MKRSLVVLLTGFAVFALVIAGCKKTDSQGPDTQTDPPGVTSEVAAMQYAVTNDGFVTNDEATFVDKAVEDPNVSTFGKVDSAVIPVRWGRFVNPGGITRTVTVTVLPGDTISVVNIQKEILGNFAILAKNNPQDTTFFLVQKPFHDHSSRNVIMKRITRTGHFMGRWLPVASSLVEGATVAPNDNIRITRAVSYYANGDSLVIDNPDSTYLRYRWTYLFAPGRHNVPEYLPGQRVKLAVTVVSKDPTGDFVGLRYGVNAMHHKRALLDLVPGSELNNGDGTFTRVYETSRNPNRFLFMHYHAGWFNMGIDAMTKATLLENPAQYSASWWGVPYRVF